MITLKHSINLETLIDEHKMPSHLLSLMLNMEETMLSKMLEETFISALNEYKIFEKINEGSSYAVVRVAE